MTRRLIEAYKDSGISIEEICSEHNLKPRTFQRWLNGTAMPNKKNQEKIGDIVMTMKKKPRLTRHPSYGYATEEQIKRLEQIGICPERDQIMSAIAYQNQSGGKVK